MIPDASHESIQFDESVQNAPRNRLHSLLVVLSRRTRSFLQANRESWLAKRTCTFYLGKDNKESHRTCQTALQTRLRLRPSQVLNFLESSLGAEMLERISRLFRWSNGDRNDYVLKEMLLRTAADPEGMSLISLLKKITAFPLNTDQVLLTTSRFEQLLQATRFMVQTIRALAIAEASQYSETEDALQQEEENGSHAQKTQISSPLTSLLAAGEFGVQRRILNLYDEKRDRSFRVLLFTPVRWSTKPTSVIVLSHGLGSNPEDMAVYAEFLTSHGFVTAAVQHPGSDSSYLRDMLNGRTTEVFQITEFIDRPLDVTFLLDYLEQCNTSMFDGQLDLNSVGIVGHSFGGYTAFVLAGGVIHFDKLEAACGPVFNAPNMSLFLQCRALSLPRKPYDLCDRRVRAIFVLDSVGSEVFGRAGLHHITIPVFLVAGSEDHTTPAALEQIRIFPWLTSSSCYLSLIEGKSHVNDLRKLMAVLDLDIEMPQELLGDDTSILDSYIHTFSTAFFKVYLTQDRHYQPYLRSHYAQLISQNSYPLSLISETSSQALESALETIGAQLVADNVRVSQSDIDESTASIAPTPSHEMIGYIIQEGNQGE